ncbi:hypothetical protein Ddc_05030 [Ditylenchus destructor]|nr:hypothetical protein Ddc_05030 [Ditylenchus destructor]
MTYNSFALGHFCGHAQGTCSSASVASHHPTTAGHTRPAGSEDGLARYEDATIFLFLVLSVDIGILSLDRLP